MTLDKLKIRIGGLKISIGFHDSLISPISH